MKTCIGGNGADTTAAVLAWLQANNELRIAHLYLLGEPDHPNSIWLTDYESPLAWPIAGTFYPAVIKRGKVTSTIGLDVQELDLTWGAKRTPATNSISTANPYQLARMGFYDNWPVRVWSCYMPTPGDANTFGCSELFGGRISTVSIRRGSLQFKVKSFLDIVNQYVPTNVIELLNTLAAYQGATPPTGFSQIPQFVVETDSSPTSVVGFQSFPNLGGLLDTNVARGGFLVFNTVPPNPSANPPVLGSTLGGVWSAIQQNTRVRTGGTSGGSFNQFILYTPLPWAPVPGRDSFYVSGASPINKADGDYAGFAFVPSPESAF